MHERMGMNDNTMAQQRAAAAMARLPAEAGSLNGRRLNILIIDPEEDFQRAIVQQVRLLGHIATALSNCTDAWMMMQSVHFDLVILDLETPAISALELARRARAQQDGVTIIATSHNVSARNRLGQQLARSNGIAQVIHKGVPTKSFVLEVQDCLEMAATSSPPAKQTEPTILVAEAD